MQHGEVCGGGVYSAPPIPPDQSVGYGGSPNYGPAPPSAPSAPSYHLPPHVNNPSVPAYNSLTNFSSDSSQQLPIPSYSTSYVSHTSPPSSHADQYSSSPLLSYSNSYPPSYAPVVPPPPPPSYQAVDSHHDRSGSFEIGAGFAPQFTPSVDSTAPQQPSYYGNSGYGAAAAHTSAGYDSYSQLGQGGYSSQREQGYGGPIYDQGTGYDYESGAYGSRGATDGSYDSGAFSDVYAYDGGGAEPYGARGSVGISETWAVSGGYSSSDNKLGSSTKIARATPKAEGDAEAGGVQRFRVKLLPEARSMDPIKDVVCQIGLDGVRIVDPSTSKTLRIYPLDTITKWEVQESSVFTFWAKSAVDVDQRIIQLKSSNYTTTAILDTLTAACVQLLEMVGKDGQSDGSNSAGGTSSTFDAGAIKKGSVLDWVSLRPRVVATEEKEHWVPDEAATKCTSCGRDFGAFLRRHHCRNCGDLFCDSCTRGRIALNTDEGSQPVRVCDRCLAEVTHRLENMTKASSKTLAPQRTHEDLAKKLQEELERNHAGRKPVLTSSQSGNGNSRQTSVLNCTKCGSVTLVVGNNSRCSNCGANPGNMSSSTEKAAGAFGASAGPRGPVDSWSNNDQMPARPGPRMREVACPTCTVHLQVQVPDFGTETVECGVCQHPFLVSA